MKSVGHLFCFLSLATAGILERSNYSSISRALPSALAPFEPAFGALEVTLLALLELVHRRIRWRQGAKLTVVLGALSGLLTACRGRWARGCLLGGHRG